MTSVRAKPLKGARARHRPSKSSPEDVDSKSRNLNTATTLVSTLLVIISISVVTIQSHRMLYPIYGSIPSNYYFRVCFVALICQSFILGKLISKPINLNTSILILPVSISLIPKLHPYLYSWSDSLGPRWGPSLTDLASLTVPLTMAFACLDGLLVCRTS